jgi:hypothetical protein
MARGTKLLSLQLIVLFVVATVLLGLIGLGGTVDGLAKSAADPRSQADIDAGTEPLSCSQTACPRRLLDVRSPFLAP